jgi:hypothetical protein
MKTVSTMLDNAPKLNNFLHDIFLFDKRKTNYHGQVNMKKTLFISVTGGTASSGF